MVLCDGVVMVFWGLDEYCEYVGCWCGWEDDGVCSGCI